MNIEYKKIKDEWFVYLDGVAQMRGKNLPKLERIMAKFERGERKHYAEQENNS